MSKEIVRLERERKIEERNYTVLQEIYEGRGGEGDVKEFLIKGATDPQDGQAEHWGTMTDEERELWLDLHATGLTGVQPNIRIYEF